MNRISFYWLPFSNQVKYSSLISNSRTNESQFRNTVWDPILIISQIVALQCLFYLTLGIWLFLICFLVGTSRSLDHIFRYQEIHVRDFPGKLSILAFILNALTGAFSLWFVVQRAKLCLDFSCTVHFIHLIACWLYTGYFPFAVSWWCLNTICLAITCIFGEFLCMRSELKAIPLSMGQKTDL